MTLLMQVLQVADVGDKRITSHQTNVTYQVDRDDLKRVKDLTPGFAFEQTPSTSVGFTSRLIHRAHLKVSKRASTMQVFSHSLNFSMRYVYGVFPSLVGMRNECPRACLAARHGQRPDERRPSAPMRRPIRLRLSQGFKICISRSMHMSLMSRTRRVCARKAT